MMDPKLMALAFLMQALYHKVSMAVSMLNSLEVAVGEPLTQGPKDVVEFEKGVKSIMIEKAGGVPEDPGVYLMLATRVAEVIEELYQTRGSQIMENNSPEEAAARMEAFSMGVNGPRGEA